MTYLDLIRDADRQLDDGRITLGEYEKMIEPLNREIDHIADTGRKVEQTAEIAQNVQDEDVISRKAAIEALARMMPRSYTPDGSHPADEEIFRAQEVFADCIEALEILPSAQPEILACGEGELNVPDTNVGDMISRRAAIDALHMHLMYRMGTDSNKKRLDEWINNLPSAQPEPKWIPCSERLPYAEYGESDNVLATCGYRDVEDGSIRWIKTLYFNGGNWCYPTGETYLEKVYAWMPLPEPYRGGDA